MKCIWKIPVNMSLFMVLIVCLGQTAIALNPICGSDPLTNMSLYDSRHLATAAFVEVSHSGFAQAWQVETTGGAQYTWDVQLVKNNEVAIAWGDLIEFVFYARSLSGSDPEFLFRFQQNHSPYDSIIHRTIRPDTAWRRYAFQVKSNLDFAVARGQVQFQLGFGPQVIQIGGLQVNSIGTAQLYEGNSVLGSDPVGSMSLLDPSGHADGAVIAVTEQTFSHAYRIETAGSSVEADAVELSASTTQDIPAGSLLHLVFYARSSGVGDAKFDTVFRKATSPHIESFHLSTTVGSSWMRFSHTFTSGQEAVPGQAQVVFQLGYGPQTIDIGNLDIRQYGPPLQMEEPPLHTFNGFGHTRRVVFIEPGQPFGNQALRITLTQSKSNSWDAQFYPNPMIYPDMDVNPDDVFFMSFYARQISSNSDMGARAVSIVERFSDYQKPLSFGVIMDTNWRQYNVPFRASMTIEPGDFRAAFFTGFDPQVFEIAQMRWYYYGGLSSEQILPAEAFLDYPGRQPDAEWRTLAAANIEQYRKVDLEVEVQDANSQPIPGATVDIDMTRHHYGFGMAASYWLIDEQSPEGQAYREKLLAVCNRVVNHNCLKMPPWDGDWGPRYNRDVTLRALQWLKSSGFYVRAHVMVWPSYQHISSPARALWDSRQDAALEQYILDHIRSVATETKGYVDEWDVINEPFDNHDLMDRFGDKVMIDWFDQARLSLPTVPLFINDYAILASGGDTDTAHQQRLYDIITYLQDNYTPLDGIGMQGHFGSGSSLTSPEILFKILDRFAAFNLPIEITEFTLDFYNDQVEADYMRDFLTVIFSHPSTVGFMQWDFWPQDRTPKANHLYRMDGSIKPKGQAYLDLVYNTWWTRQNGTTNAAGRFTAPDRAFKGTYQIQASYGEHSAVLEDVEVLLDKSDADRVIVTLDME